MCLVKVNKSRGTVVHHPRVPVALSPAQQVVSSAQERDQQHNSCYRHQHTTWAPKMDPEPGTGHPRSQPLPPPERHEHEKQKNRQFDPNEPILPCEEQQVAKIQQPAHSQAHPGAKETLE